MTQPKSAEKGYIYCVHSAALPDLYKIGASTNHPLERARQLSMSTSAASPFFVAYHKHVAFPFQAEAKIHRLLKDYRVNESRESFKVPLARVIELFDAAESIPETPIALDPVDLEPTPWAELFNSFPDDGSPRELTVDEQRMCRELASHIKSGNSVY